ncbi:hypothetical protein ACK8OR_07635 [Jannaschia sp. KMU-145]|uniref:hypothetical protein n=1 Tax=Jannaschia halovivens TaxID=3388667 RepID=UPI00396AF10B
MTADSAGGLAAIVCAATYVVGFALLVTVLAPLGYGTNAVDAVAVTAFAFERPGLFIAWNMVIYILNGLALAVLVVALHARLAPAAPGPAALSRMFGTIWATLVLAAGMIANIAVEGVRAGTVDPGAAAERWRMLHAVELGLGGGNEIAGGVWILTISLTARGGPVLGPVAPQIGVATSVAGLATILPPLWDAAGTVFGLGAIGWFLAVGAALLGPTSAPTRA